MAGVGQSGRKRKGFSHHPVLFALRQCRGRKLSANPGDGGLTDPRVTYWEPAKWIARLRATMSGGGPVLLRTNMGAGHGGASGRFNRLDEVAIVYAFALWAAGLAEKAEV